MMFIMRSNAGPPTISEVAVKVSRKTPDIIPEGRGKTDYFCVAPPAAMAALREAGTEVVELHDGWYADDTGGGIAIWGQGRYWEVRDSLFTVKEAAGPAGDAVPGERPEDEPVNIRGAVFGV